MVEKIKYDAILIECDDNPVTIDSLVNISPFDAKTNTWRVDIQKVVTMKEALGTKNVRLIAKGNNVLNFIEEEIQKNKK